LAKARAVKAEKELRGELPVKREKKLRGELPDDGWSQRELERQIMRALRAIGGQRAFNKFARKHSAEFFRRFVGPVALRKVQAAQAPVRSVEENKELEELRALKKQWENDGLEELEAFMREWHKAEAEQPAGPATPGCVCGHAWEAHCGHTYTIGQPEPHHCGQCACVAYKPAAANPIQPENGSLGKEQVDALPGQQQDSSFAATGGADKVNKGELAALPGEPKPEFKPLALCSRCRPEGFPNCTTCRVANGSRFALVNGVIHGVRSLPKPAVERSLQCEKCGENYHGVLPPFGNLKLCPKCDAMPVGNPAVRIPARRWKPAPAARRRSVNRVTRAASANRPKARRVMG
jgi:hypothetical protein